MPEYFRNILGGEEVEEVEIVAKKLGCQGQEKESDLDRKGCFSSLSLMLLRISKYINSSYLKANSNKPVERECLKTSEHEKVIKNRQKERMESRS